MSLKERLGVSLVLLVVAGLTLADLSKDFKSGTTWDHVFIEACVIAVALAGVIGLWYLWSQNRKLNVRLKSDLAQVQKDLVHWKSHAQNHINGLSDAIDAQLSNWKLTSAEKEIALLLLKGLSFKEVAEARNATERTVRQQSLEIYKKSGLAGRAEFAAFFLEDLLSPKQAG